MFFWVTVIGGLLLAISPFYDPRGITANGGLVLFVLGVILFLSRAVAESRRQGIGLGRALVASLKRAVRFAWAMMP